MNVLERLIGVMAPHNCVVCDAEGEVLCRGCLYSELASVPSRCYRCYRASAQHAVCSGCRKSTSIKNMWIAAHYDQAAKELLHKLKYERAIAGAKTVAGAIRNSLPNLPPNTVICYVPTANGRVRKRGYDQAREIAARLAKLSGLSEQPYLARRGKSRQVGSGRTDRFKQLEGAFRARNTNKLKGSTVLLVDDVITTGATIESAAKILKQNGAKNIYAAVFAQA